MKKYFFGRIKMFFEIIVIVCIVFLTLHQEEVEPSSVSLTSNNALLNVSVDESIMLKAQSDLYKKGTFNPIYTFVGDLTGYGGDCALCSGHLGCPPNIDVLKYGILYNDKTYGTVRIVASSKNLSCGTIIRFNASKLSSEPIIAIVLDRGVGGNDIDLLTESEDYARDHVGRIKNQTFEVLREGWK